MNRLSFAIFLLAFGAFSLNAQEDRPTLPCATGDYYSPWLEQYLRQPRNTSRGNDLLYVPIQVQIVGDDDGNGFITMNTLLRSFCTLQNDFEPSNIRFYLKLPIIYLSNSSYYNHDFDTGYDMIVDNNVPNAINCYIVDGAAGACGYFFPGADGVVLDKGCNQPSDHTWAHEVGHFLSLPHTFSGWEGEEPDYSQPAPNQINGTQVERVDGSNCQNAGDRFCDTPADYLNYRWACNGEIQSTVEQFDPSGEAFRSDGTFFMSYSLDQCSSRFSDEQIDAMRANIQFERSNLLNVPPPPAEDVAIPDVSTLGEISPMDDSTVEEYPVTISWDPVPNATHYLVQVNPYNIFNLIFNQYIVDEPSLVFDAAEPNRTYYWRIKPFSQYSTCSDFSDVSTFTVGNFTAVENIGQPSQLRVFPNPVQGQNINIELTAMTASAAHWQLHNTTGQLMAGGSMTLMSGQNRQQIPTDQLAAGLYYLRVQLGQDWLVNKFTVY